MEGGENIYRDEKEEEEEEENFHRGEKKEEEEEPDKQVRPSEGKSMSGGDVPCHASSPPFFLHISCNQKIF